VNNLDLKWDKIFLRFFEKKSKINHAFTESKDMLKGCRLNAIMLINLVNDLLDLAKQENLTFELNLTFFSLTDSIKDAFETMKFISETRKIKTILDV
jgi:signal transduction histidine kinase